MKSFSTSRRRAGRRLSLIALLAAVATVVGGSAAFATSIPSSGPLTDITISPDLNCSVNHSNDSSGEWYGGTACATLVAIGSTLYGPADIPAGGSATGSDGYTAYTPVSQTAASGAGTTDSPWSVTTVVDLGTSGVELTEVDTYVVGQESYRTTVTLASPTAVSARIYRGGDCFLQDSDNGLGAILAGSSPVCKADPSSVNPDRIEGFFPLTAGSHYYENFYNDMWATIATKDDLPDTCACDSLVDNAVALSWLVSVAAGGTSTVDALTTFSPVGNAPITFTKTADTASVPAGSADGYTVTLSNPGLVPAALTSVTDSLPAGFAYAAGSTTGASTADPTVSGQSLKWTGSFVVPAATGTTPGKLSLHFGVTASSAAGTYTNSVTGDGPGITAVPAVNVAPVTVVAVNQPPTVSTGGPYTGNEGSPITLTGTTADPEGDDLYATWTVVPLSGTDAGAACAVPDPASLTTTVTCNDDGVYTATLSVTDRHSAAVTSSTTITVSNVAPSVTISAPADATVVTTGTAVHLTARVSDPASNDTLTCAVDWGDGTHDAGTITGGVCADDHSYAAAGSWTVTVSATDDDGGIGTAHIGLTSVLPVNHPPTAGAGGPYTGNEGSPVSLSGTASDPDGDTLTTSWSVVPLSGTDAGAACVVANPAALSTTVTCNDDGVFNATLSVSDGHNPPVTSTATVTVANVDPSVSITSPADGTLVATGTVVNLKATITDPGSNDTLGCSIDWGDSTIGPGTLTAGVCSGSHTYAADGARTITVTGTDDNGGTGSASIVLTTTTASTQKVSGGGFLAGPGHGCDRVSFGFFARTADSGNGFVGQIQVYDGKYGFQGSTVSDLVVSGNRASWSGTGRWNGRTGYTYTVSVVDNGRAGARSRIPDTIHLTITSRSGSKVLDVSGSIRDGNITVE